VPLLDVFCRQLIGTVRQGEFGAHMHVESVNDGPVTITLDTEMWLRPARRLTD
jgi:D-tyrosyl-tRNA(Tyr) deacylase